LTTLWLLAWGVAVLALRVGWQLEPVSLLWGGLGLAPMLVLAGLDAYRRRPGLATALSLLDRHNRAGGLVTVASERPVGRWADRVSGLALPRVQWRSGRAWLLAGVAAVFLLGSFLAPARFTRAEPPPGLNVSDQVAQLDKQIKTLEEEKLLEEQQSKQLDKQLNQVKEEARGDNPTKTWEALDRVRSKLSQRAQEAAEQTQRRNRELGEAEALAEAMREVGDELSESLNREATQQLKQRMQQAAAASEQVQRQMDDALREALKDQAQKLSKEQLERLAELAEQTKVDLNRQMEKLHEARLVDARTLRQCKKGGQCNLKRLKLALKRANGNEGKKRAATQPGKEGDSRKAVQMALQQAGGGMPGRGGRSDGPGAAPMQWKDQASSEKNVDFTPRRLPSDQQPALDQSRRVGMSAAAPEVNQEAGPSQGGALSEDAAGEGGASQHRVLPKHRQTVERYFQRGESNEGE
jgi:hypothetical protein